MPAFTETEIRLARQRFPAGLHQPHESYRFGLEALLLAAFGLHMASKARLAKRQDFRAAEIGCGCGAALLAFALGMPNAFCIGLDNEKSLIKCANKNARLIAADNAFFLDCNAEEVGRNSAMKSWLRHCSLAFANPPWRKLKAGRQPRASLRRAALVADDNVFKHFCRAARELLRYHAIFCCILPSGLLPEFCATAARYKLGLRHILPVANFTDENAIRILLAFRKEAASQPTLAAPLILHEREGGAWSSAALQFCPWLAGGQVEANVE